LPEDDKLKLSELKVIGEETRIKILELLSERGELGLSEISKLIKKAKSTTFQHLKILIDNGAIKKTIGTKGYLYSLSLKGERVIDIMKRNNYEELKINNEKVSSQHLKIIKVPQNIPKGASYIIPIMLGSSMALFGGLQYIAVLCSIIGGIFFGVIESTIKEFINGGILFSIFVAIAGVIREREITMAISLFPALIIYIFVGGLAWIGIKRLTSKNNSWDKIG